MINILFCGIGGQGVLKASEICCTAALFEGRHVKKSEVHGMAQRGGSVESHVRLSAPGQSIYSPLIIPGQADYLVCFHRDEEERLKGYLKSGGVDFLPYLDDFEKSFQDRRFLNTFCLGILSSFLSLKEQSWTRALDAVFTRARDTNRRVFQAGRELTRR